MRPLLDKFYATEHCQALNAYLDKSVSDEAKDDATPAQQAPNKKEKKAYLKSLHGRSEQFSILTVTLALGKQLMLEHSHFQTPSLS